MRQFRSAPRSAPLERYDRSAPKSSFAGNQFDYVVSNAFFNVSGVDNFPLQKGDKDSKPYSNRIEQLQLALNKLEAKPSLVADGKFGALTVSALKSLGYPSSVDSNLWQAIISKSYSAGNTPTSTTGREGASPSSNVSEADMKLIWAKEFASGKTKLKYDDWLKKENRNGKFQKIGQGIFNTLTQWLQNKNQMNDMNIPTGDQYKTTDDEDLTRMWGMPKPLAYGLIAVGSGLALWGIVALGIKISKSKTPTQTAPPVAG